MLVVNGIDYGIILIIVLAFAVIAALQYILCVKAKNKYLKLLPCVFGAAFAAFAVAAQFGSSGGFIDLRGYVGFLCMAAAGLCFLAQGTGWGIWKIKNR